MNLTPEIKATFDKLLEISLLEQNFAGVAVDAVIDSGVKLPSVRN